MKKRIKILFTFLLLVAPVMQVNTSVELSAKRVSSGTLGSTKTRTSNSTIRTKNNYAKSNAKQQATKNTNSKQATKSKSRGFGSFLGGMFLGSLLFGHGSIMSGIFNLLFIFLIIRLIFGLFSRKKRNNQYQNQAQYKQGNQSTYYNADLTPLFNELDQLVEQANERNIDVSDILNNDTLTIHEKLNMIRNILR